MQLFLTFPSLSRTSTEKEISVHSLNCWKCHLYPLEAKQFLPYTLEPYVLAIASLKEALAMSISQCFIPYVVD